MNASLEYAGNGYVGAGQTSHLVARGRPHLLDASFVSARESYGAARLHTR